MATAGWAGYQPRLTTRVSLPSVCLQHESQVYLGVPKSVCYLPAAAASWCTEGLHLTHTMRMACPAVPEAACWVVSHKSEPRAVPGRSCKQRSCRTACLRALHQFFWGASQWTQLWPWRLALGTQSNRGGLWDQTPLGGLPAGMCARCFLCQRALMWEMK